MWRQRRAILIAASWICGSAGLLAINMAVFPLLEAINFGVTMATPSARARPRRAARGVWLIDATAGYGAVTRRAESGPVPGVAVPDVALPRGRRRATRVFPESDRQSALILPSDPAPPISHRRKDGSRPCARNLDVRHFTVLHRSTDEHISILLKCHSLRRCVVAA